MRVQGTVGGQFGLALLAIIALAASVQAHHSFAMYDMRATRVFTGVVDSVDPAVNHLQIFFSPMTEDRKGVERDAKGERIVWAVEMEGSAQAARQGISVNSFPRGTIISLALHPLRNGEPAGSRDGALFKCPERTPPAPGKHCDSVAGHTAIGTGPLPTPTK